MSDERGLYHKYQVYKRGEPVNGWCFVIEEDDPAAPEMLRLYATHAEGRGNHRLAEDLVAKAAALSGRAADTEGRE